MNASPKVVVLDSQVVNQIAAGEVVERPASVVKELVENSIDAGATEVKVIIANGGKSLIEVQDNGCGMSESNLLIALQRHGTSKILNADNLLEIKTLGFRGEALPTIASVSKFSITSATADNLGTQVIIESGKIIEQNKLSAKKGTKIKAVDLFYNVPARRKFLKSDNVEYNNIKAFLSDLYLANSNLRITLKSESKKEVVLPAESDFIKRANNLGFKGDDYLVIDKEYNPQLSIQAVISVPLKSASNSAKLRTLVNGRSVRDRLILTAIRSGYGAFLKSGKYPSGIFSLKIPSKDVDVNVHPQKSEVRFRDSNSIFALISSNVSRLFEGQKAVFDQSGSNQGLSREAFRVNSTQGVASYSSQSPIQQNFTTSSNQEVTFSSSSSTIHEQASFRDLRYLGKILEVYLLFSSSQSLTVLDMHAAHERVMYFKLRSQYESKSIAEQKLLIPITIELQNDYINQENVNHLNSIGFEAEMFGDSSVIIRAVPALISDCSVESVIRDVLSSDEWSLLKKKSTDAIDAVITRMACHRALRRGDSISTEQAYKLLSDLESAESSAYCPHGRPVKIELNENEFEKLFGRTGF